MFPTLKGETVAKVMVLEDIEFIAVGLGLYIISPDGRRAFGGHALRISGSRFLSRKGLETRVIMLLALWESEIILHYIKEAPLAKLANCTCRAERSR